MQILRKKRFLIPLIFIGLVTLIIVCKRPILQAIGSYLIYEDTLKKSDAIFVLSGDPYDRGLEAASLFNKGCSAKIVCTGESVSNDLKILNLVYTEGEMSRLNILKNEIPDSSVFLINKGTSTKEEASIILNYSLQNKFKTITIVTTKFHTKRVKKSFTKIFKDSGVEFLIKGAGSSFYAENNWWQEESGLIMVNNEYLKLFYYLIKY